MESPFLFLVFMHKHSKYHEIRFFFNPPPNLLMQGLISDSKEVLLNLIWFLSTN
jgi:hypothetical protein